MNFDYLADGASDRPMIRIYGAGPDGFLELLSHIDGLAEGRSTRVRLSDLANFTSQNARDIVLVATRSGEPGISVADEINWRLAPEHWSEVAELVRPFLKELSGSCFQWLLGPEARGPLYNADGSVLITNSEDGAW